MTHPDDWKDDPLPKGGEVAILCVLIAMVTAGVIVALLRFRS